jgi:low affinity Fe/Cu permease
VLRIENVKRNNMNQLVGAHKEFITIERDVINELEKLGKELENEMGLHTQGVGKGILKAVEVIKENNIYNKEFQIKN